MTDDRDKEIIESFDEPGITIEDFKGWLLGKQSQGLPGGLLLKQAIISINKLVDAADRWNRLEATKQRSAPIWMNEKEAVIVIKALNGVKGADARLLRQDVRDTFAP